MNIKHWTNAHEAAGGMTSNTQSLSVSLATTPEEVRQVQALRYQVFAHELGVTGDSVLENEKREADLFDDVAEHLTLRDLSLPRGRNIIGSYRLISSPQSERFGFSSDREFDHSRLINSGASLLELSRSCLHPDYRGGKGMFLLWQALSQLVTERQIEILFGVASFWGTNAGDFSEPLSLLDHLYLAPKNQRSISRIPAVFDRHDEDQIDKRRALRQIPPLIKAYLRLGGKVGRGAYVDHEFKTVDVCMIVDLKTIGARERAIYGRTSHE